MKAMLSHTPGGPETLILTEISLKEPKEGEICIAVKAAGVNFPDTLIIRDLYQIKPPRPFAPGGEVAGIIESIGLNVKDFNVGDRVLAVPGHGGFVTHINVPAITAIKIPQEMPFEDAACFIFTYGTSHYALRDRAAIKAGETLLILGAAGGVGAAAIEVGKTLGAKVIAAVSSEEKAAFCKKIGADETIVYPKIMNRDSQKDLSTKIKEIAGQNGVNVVYDAVGGNYAEPCIRSMAWNGRFLVVGFPAGIPKIPLNLILLKSCQIVGVFWGAFTMRDPKQHQKYLTELFNMYKNKEIKPQITASFPLKDAAKALASVEQRKSLGKVVLTTE
jgi:NADPH2:quinone reductase